MYFEILDAYVCEIQEDLVVGADEASGRQDSEDDASVVAEFVRFRRI